jgi:opacity protein-like surface antigen
MKLRILAFVLASMAVSASARADGGFITPYLGFNFGGDSSNCLGVTSCDDHRLNFGVGFGARHGVFGIEEDIGYAPDFFGKTGTGNGVLSVMTSALFVIPAGPIKPYALIGIGLIRPHFTTSTLTELDQNALGYDIGGGLNLSIAPKVALHGDLRHLHTLSDINFGGILSSQPLEFWRASAGLTVGF